MKRLTLGIDFDGTIVTEAFPGIGEIKSEVVELMDKAREKGHLIIVWTARSGEALEKAKEFLIENNIPFDYINENPEDPWAIAGEQGRKIFCSYYLDDRAIQIDNLKEMLNAVEGINTPKRAVLKKDISVGESGLYEEDYAHFKAGSVVEIVREVESTLPSGRQFIIYSKQLNEATVVYDGLLEFI